MSIGRDAAKLFNFDVSRCFSGSPTEKAFWMLIGSILAEFAGLPLMLRSVTWH